MRCPCGKTFDNHYVDWATGTAREHPNVNVAEIDVPAVLAFRIPAADEGGHGLLKRSRHSAASRFWLPFYSTARHNVPMAKIKVTFKPVRNSDDDWSIVAEYPGAESREITGLQSKADVDDWMNGDRRVAWLRSQGYAK